MRKTTIAKLKKSMKNYEEGSFNLFIDELGWENWMEELCEEDMETEIVQSDSDRIDNYLKTLWDIVHQDEVW